MPAAETIRELAIPVVMISANGLICLALYNRLAAITARLRLFYRERFEIDLRIVAEKSAEGSPSEAELRLRARRDVVDEQCHVILLRARYVRNALILLLSAVAGMLLITLLLGLSYQFPILARLSLVAFVVNVLMMIGGVVLAIGELLMVLEPVRAEGPFPLEVPDARGFRRRRTDPPVEAHARERSETTDKV